MQKTQIATLYECGERSPERLEIVVAGWKLQRVCWWQRTTKRPTDDRIYLLQPGAIGFDRASEPSRGFLQVNKQLLEVFLSMLPLLLPPPPRIRCKRNQNARDNKAASENNSYN